MTPDSRALRSVCDRCVCGVSVCAAYVTELLSAAPERLMASRGAPADRLVRLWLRCWAGGGDLAELGPLTAAVARHEPLVPNGPPGEERTAARFAERLGTLAEQVSTDAGRVTPPPSHRPTGHCGTLIVSRIRPSDSNTAHELHKLLNTEPVAPMALYVIWVRSSDTLESLAKGFASARFCTYLVLA